jgi:hypothetical protein
MTIVADSFPAPVRVSLNPQASWLFCSQDAHVSSEWSVTVASSFAVSGSSSAVSPHFSITSGYVPACDLNAVPLMTQKRTVPFAAAPGSRSSGPIAAGDAAGLSPALLVTCDNPSASCFLLVSGTFAGTRSGAATPVPAALAATPVPVYVPPVPVPSPTGTFAPQSTNLPPDPAAPTSVVSQVVGAVVGVFTAIAVGFCLYYFCRYAKTNNAINVQTHQQFIINEFGQIVPNPFYRPRRHAQWHQQFIVNNFGQIIPNPYYRSHRRGRHFY